MKPASFNLIRLDTCASTNSHLATIARDAPHATVVTAVNQTSGRGQRGNTWEAAPGMNLTFSMLLRQPGIFARDQFLLSEAVALGIADTLRPLLPGHEVTVKWPNDIYVGDSKICGILIENSLSGPMIAHSIAGIGINVNQRRFVSDAPNPTSLAMLTGMTFDLDSLLDSVVAAISARLQQPHPDRHADFMESLWRRDRLCYRDAATGEIFYAKIAAVAPSGLLSLIDDNARLRSYAFKEVRAILPCN